MKLFRPHLRPIFCGLILIAFFLPSYNGYSAFEFILFIFSDTLINYGLTSTDAFVAASPLLFILIATIIISIRSFFKLPTRKIYTMLPFLLFLFFVVIIFEAEGKNGIKASGYDILSRTHIGIYIMLMGSSLLPFTRNYRRKRRKMLPAEHELAI